MLRPVLAACAIVFSSVVFADDYEYQVYFGLSKADGAVSLAEWETFEASFAEAFAGFTVSSATGYYLSSKERSRVITLFMDECREPALEAQARKYAIEFQQQSVLITKKQLESWKSVGAQGTKELDDSCSGK